MLANPHLEAVIVATADQFHTSMASRALAAGKHVLVEKPLGVSVEECEALRTHVKESALLLQVGTMKRFDPGIAFAHQFIQEEIGQLLSRASPRRFCMAYLSMEQVLRMVSQLYGHWWLSHAQSKRGNGSR